MVVEVDPVADRTRSMLLALEAVPMHALFLQGPDDPLYHAVLLRALRSDELLAQTIATRSRV